MNTIVFVFSLLLTTCSWAHSPERAERQLIRRLARKKFEIEIGDTLVALLRRQQQRRFTAMRPLLSTDTELLLDDNDHNRPETGVTVLPPTLWLFSGGDSMQVESCCDMDRVRPGLLIGKATIIWRDATNNRSTRRQSVQVTFVKDGDEWKIKKVLSQKA